MRVLLIDPDPARAALVAEGLACVDPLEVRQSPTFDAGEAAGFEPDVIVVARDSAAALAERLIAEGMSAATPAAAIENAGAPTARIRRATLETLPAVLAREGFDGPVVLLIGEVAALARTGTVEREAPDRKILGRRVG